MTNKAFIKRTLELLCDLVKEGDYKLGGYTDHKIYFSELREVDIFKGCLQLESASNYVEISLDKISSIEFGYDGNIDIRLKGGALYNIWKNEQAD